MQPFHAEIASSLSGIPKEEWNRFAGDNPFLCYPFLSALEQSGSAIAETGWQPYHIVLKAQKDDTIKGFLPCYLKSHSFGEYVFDHAWANAYERAGGNYYPKLQSCIPFTPATCQRMLTKPDDIEAKKALLQALKGAVQQLAIPTAHLTFLEKQETDIAAELGFLIRTDQQFHWRNKGYKNFDEFLAELSSRKRKQIRKERRQALDSGIEIERLRGGQITSDHLDQFFAFYQDTGARKWGQPYLNRDFFEQIHGSMADKILLFMCKREDRYIAGAINFLSATSLYGRYWGCLEDHPCLHFETCYYQAIDFAIEHGLERVEAGAQGPHKLARGYEPVKTYSAHWIANEGFRDAVDRFLRIEREEVDAEVEYLNTRTPFKER